MPASEARIAAARANGMKSKGPRTAEGKAVSRRNALKHGMAGQGVVLPPEDAAEVERRSTAMEAEMRPSTTMGGFLVRRMALLTVRVERCGKQEIQAADHRVRHAAEAFDEARLAEVDRAIASIADEPVTLGRKLRSMPEGVDRLIAELLAIRDEVASGVESRWDPAIGERLSHLTGRRWPDLPVHWVRALSEAVGGEFRYLLPDDGPGLDDPSRRAWARGRLVELIDEEVAALLADREGLDFEAIEEDRAGAPARASFDPSKEAALARRYEAAAEREVFRALRQFREVEADAREVAEAEPQPEPLGSSRAAAPVDRPEPAPEVIPPSRGADHTPPTTSAEDRARLDRLGEALLKQAGGRRAYS